MKRAVVRGQPTCGPCVSDVPLLEQRGTADVAFIYRSALESSGSDWKVCKVARRFLGRSSLLGKWDCLRMSAYAARKICQQGRKVRDTFEKFRGTLSRLGCFQGQTLWFDRPRRSIECPMDSKETLPSWESSRPNPHLEESQSFLGIPWTFPASRKWNCLWSFHLIKGFDIQSLWVML